MFSSHILLGNTFGCSIISLTSFIFVDLFLFRTDGLLKEHSFVLKPSLAHYVGIAVIVRFILTHFFINLLVHLQYVPSQCPAAQAQHKNYEQVGHRQGKNLSNEERRIESGALTAAAPSFAIIQLPRACIKAWLTKSRIAVDTA